jgi:nucleoside-diphosphate-sugar epimerase
MRIIVFTGFPGFLGSELLPRVLAREHDAKALVLVQSKFAPLAKTRIAELEAARPELAGRIEAVEGDIVDPRLGLKDSSFRDQVREVYHLAAVYDLSVAREVGMRVNVVGTRNMLELASECGNLERFHYVSTCYVSGRHPGVFTEDDLDKGQAFNNFYEETKFLAEVEVTQAAKQGLPVTVYRPSVVVGDSRTGATQKYDGPYFVIRWLMRQPRLAILPTVGSPEKYRFNVVPRDYVVDAIAWLSGRPESIGKVYQIADPEPLTVDATIDAIAKATGRRVLRVPLPRSVAKGAIDYVPGVYWLMQIPSSSVDYFVHPTDYTNRNTARDLEGSGVVLPPFASYLGRLVDFVRAHPNIGAAAMT